jgi:hypothetical protein
MWVQIMIDCVRGTAAVFVPLFTHQVFVNVGERIRKFNNSLLHVLLVTV